MRRVFKALGLPAFVLLSLSVGPFAAADVLDKTATINGTTLRYKVVVPRNFDPAKAYPALNSILRGKAVAPNDVNPRRTRAPDSPVRFGKDRDALDMRAAHNRQNA